MSRPKYAEGDRTAREKLVHAFWAKLAEGSYATLSVVGLCQQAGVNKNTFYYHFENIDELAALAAEDLFESQFLCAMVEAISGKAPLPGCFAENAFREKLDRVCLLAADESSPTLKFMLRDAVAKAWTSAFALAHDTFDLKEQASFEFVLGGFLGVLAFRARSGCNFSFEDAVAASYSSHALDIVRSLPHRQG